MRRLLLAVVLAGAPAGCGDDSGGGELCSPPEGTLPALRLEEVWSGFTNPVGVVSPPGDLRLYVVEQGGTIRIVEDGVLVEEAFLDISDRVTCCGEQGLLGLA